MTVFIVVACVVAWVLCGALTFHLLMLDFSKIGPVTMDGVAFAALISAAGPIGLVTVTVVRALDRMQTEQVSPYWSKRYPHHKNEHRKTR